MANGFVTNEEILRLRQTVDTDLALNNQAHIPDSIISHLSRLEELNKRIELERAFIDNLNTIYLTGKSDAEIVSNLVGFILEREKVQALWENPIIKKETFSFILK